jgi:hypothetical protein
MFFLVFDVVKFVVLTFSQHKLYLNLPEISSPSKPIFAKELFIFFWPVEITFHHGLIFGDNFANLIRLLEFTGQGIHDLDLTSRRHDAKTKTNEE